jgi:hypothetical protein
MADRLCQCRCIAYATADSPYCIVHLYDLDRKDRTEEADWSLGHLRPVTDRIEYERATAPEREDA